MGGNIDIHIQDQEQAEDALSLSDFHLTTDEFDGTKEFPEFQDHPPSSSEPTELFEFFSELTFDMSYAEDIIFCGKLIPFNPKPLSNQTHELNDHIKLQVFHPPRSESQSELKTSRLRRTARDPSGSANFDTSGGGFKVPKPRWYVLMTFGVVKFPPEMDLRDIKDRQTRRKNTATLFPSFDATKKLPVNRRDRKRSWGLLRVLSCKDDACVAVTAHAKNPMTCHRKGADSYSI